MLAGAAIMAFGATKPWVALSGAVPWGKLAGLQLGHSLGFDQVVLQGPTLINAKGLVLGATLFVAIMSAVLLVTHTPGVGVVWRAISFVGTGLVAAVCAGCWMFVNNPVSTLTGGDDSLGSTILGGLQTALEDANMASVEPALGLWLVTIGGAIAVLGSLIPAFKTTVYRPGPPPSVLMPPMSAAQIGPMSAGWYPDQSDRKLMRWFDGNWWTTDTRPRITR
jgi:hypothetical protein